MTDGMMIQGDDSLPWSLIGLPMALACLHGRWRWRKSDGLYECISCKHTAQFPGRVPFPQRREIEDELEYRDALRAYHRWYYQANNARLLAGKRESQARYRAANRKRVNAARRDYYERNAEQERLAAQDRRRRRPKHIAKIQAKSQKKMRLLDPEGFRERNREHEAIRRMRRPYIRELFLSILIIQCLAEQWDEALIVQRADVKLISHEQVEDAIKAFEDAGGTITKLPERDVAKVFHVQLKDG